MATLAPGGRITVAEVSEEVARLQRGWAAGSEPTGGTIDAVLGAGAAAKLDRFDRVQLEDVLAVCGASSSLSEAGRALFAESRRRKTSRNDADRLRKYLARFDLDWDAIRAGVAD